jgi:hypothetical protein
MWKNIPKGYSEEKDYSENRHNQCVQALMGAFSYYPTQTYEIDNFFNYRKLTKVLSTKPLYTFASFLDYSEWSKSFMHWADMFPWMVEWFSNYLSERGLRLWVLKRVRFKEKTKGDLIYVIMDKKDEISEKKSPVLGEFTDNNGKSYYFYTDCESIKNQRKVLKTDLTKNLLLGQDATFTSFSTFTYDLINAEEDIYVKLHDQWKNHKVMRDLYTDLMHKNSGFMLAVLADIINLVYSIKRGGGGLVIGYENIVIHSEFKPEALLKGECRIHTKTIGECKKIWPYGLWSMHTCEVLQDGKIMVSLKVSLYREEL